MSELAHPRLCGGTFLTLLLEAKEKRDRIRDRYEDKKDHLSEENTFAELIKIVKPGHEKVKNGGTPFKITTTSYKFCEIPKNSARIPFNEQPVIDTFDDCVMNNYKEALDRMKGFTDNFIDKEKGQWLIQKLLGLIESDESIGDNDEFYVNSNEPIKKSELCILPRTERIEHLPAFLLGVWHFIVTKRRDNTIGKKTVNEWHGKLKVEDKRGEFKCPDQLGAKWKNKIKLVDTWTDIKNTDYIEGEGFQSSERDTQNDAFLVKPEKDGIPVYRRSTSDSTEATKEKIRNDDTSVEPELEASEYIAQKKEIYERQIPMDLALEKLGERAVLDEMFRSFKQTYDDFGIADYIKGTPDCEPDIASFVALIDSGILSSYEEHFENDIYKLIVEFCTELKKFNKLVSLNISNKQAGELDKLAKERKKINLLYEKIFNAGVELSIFSNGYDHATDKVSYIWRRTSDR